MDKPIILAIEWIDAAEVKEKKLNELEHIKPPIKITYGRLIKEDEHTLYMTTEETIENSFWDAEMDTTIIPKSLILYRRELNDNNPKKEV